MPDHIITGFHAVEERIRRAAESGATAGLSVQYGTTGPRVKKILELAKKAGIPAQATDDRALDALVQHLPHKSSESRPT